MKGDPEALISRPRPHSLTGAVLILSGLFLVAFAAVLAPDVGAFLVGSAGALMVSWEGRHVYRKRRSSVHLSRDSIVFTHEDGQAYTYPWDALRAVSSSGALFRAHLEGERFPHVWGHDWVGAAEVAAALQGGSFSMQPGPFKDGDSRSELALHLDTTLRRVDRLLAIVSQVAPEARPRILFGPGPLHDAAVLALGSPEGAWPTLLADAWPSERGTLEGRLWVGASSWSVTSVVVQLFAEEGGSEWLLSCSLGRQLGACLARGKTTRLEDTTALPSTLMTGAFEERAEALELVLDGAPRHLALPEASVLTVERVPDPQAWRARYRAHEGGDVETAGDAIVRLRWEGAWWTTTSPESIPERIPGRLDVVAKLAIES